VVWGSATLPFVLAGAFVALDGVVDLDANLVRALSGHRSGALFLVGAPHHGLRLSLGGVDDGIVSAFIAAEATS